MDISFKRKVWNNIKKYKILRVIFEFAWEIFKQINRILLMPFFDKKYMYGKWFDSTIVGWKWMWKGILWQKILGINRHVRWPVYHTTKITKPVKIQFHRDDLQIFQSSGCYFQCYGNITIGKGCYIAPNVGLITANHSIKDLDKHDDPKDIVIKNNCWIGMNSVLLPGVVLNEYTIVGAGAVVNKEFNGNSIVAGVPAKIIKNIGDRRKSDEE